MAYGEALEKAGAFLGSNRLKPSSNSTTVRVANGKTQVLDGPYADTKEQVGGYYLIDVADLDAAISWASRCPAASHGVVEVRPVWQINERTLVSFPGGDDARRTADAVARRSYGKLVAFLASRTRTSRQPRTRSRRHSLRRSSTGRRTAARAIPKVGCSQSRAAS